MKNIILILFLAFMTGCNQHTKSVSDTALSFIEASSRYVVSGKEKMDGTTSSTNYTFKFNNPKAVEIQQVWIANQAYTFEQFEYEKAYYVVVQVYGNNRSNERSVDYPFSSVSAALLMYEENGETKYIKVDEITKKENVEGK